LDLVKHSIELGQHIDRFKGKNSSADGLLDEIFSNVYATASSLSTLVNLIKSENGIPFLEKFIEPIVKSLIGCKIAILQEWRQWKQLLKFEYSVRTGASSFDNARFRRDNPMVFLKILLAQHRLSMTKQIFARLKFFIRMANARTTLFPENHLGIKKALKRLGLHHDSKLLVELHILAKPYSGYELQIKPIIVAFEEQSRYRLICLGILYDLNYQQELMGDVQLQEANYKSGIGAPLWNRFIAHKYHEYLRLVSNDLT
jgi:hypothetical protein